MWALVDAGRPGDALEQLGRAVSLGEGRWLALANLGRAYAGVGRTTEARAVLARLERDWGDTGFGNFAMAAIHVALGEREAALQRLEHVYRVRFAKLPDLRQRGASEPLYGDPDFQRIVREAGLRAGLLSLRRGSGSSRSGRTLWALAVGTKRRIQRQCARRRG